MTVTVNGTTGIAGVDGSAATPAVQGADTNTGVFYGTDIVAISTGGTERMRVNAFGRVGIGITTLDAKLAVSNSGAATLEFYTNYPGGGVGTYIQSYNRSGAAYVSTAYDAVDHSFRISGTERMLIDSSGNVAIGTSTPGAILHTTKTSAGAATVGAFLQNSSDTASTEVRLAFASNNAVLSSDRYGWIGHINTGGTNGGALTFATTPGGTAATERMRITSGGDLLVGCTSQANAARATWQTATNNSRFIGFQTIAGAEIGYIFNNTTATQYSTTSDYRLKKDIVPMTGALAKVQALKPVTYKWKSNDLDAEGFIAHELAEVCPSAVVGTKDAVNENGDPNYQGIDTSFLVATLTAAIQEQQAMITALTARITALEVTP